MQSDVITVGRCFNGILPEGKRKQKGIKQEDIAEAVGVSPQAVSKWESGGMPDAALLPSIADSLGVTIDALFGREEETRCFEEQFMHQIADIPYSARFHRIFEIARLSSLAMMGETHYDENCFSQAEDVYTQIIDDYGILIGRVRTVKNPFLLLLPEPENGFESAITPDERMAELFSALGDTNVLKAMFFLQKHEKAFSLFRHSWKVWLLIGKLQTQLSRNFWL